MFRFALATTLATAQQVTQDDHPHLAQAWQALSSGDGLPNTVGLESYIYEEGCEKSDTCMKAHVFDYGADNCIKYEVDAGFHSKYSGTYYVKCDSVNCCRDQDYPDVKKWDIGQAKKSTVTHLEATDLDDLDGHVAGADTWEEDIKVFSATVKYTYYVTQSGDDIISHAIDYSAPGTSPGRILYGNFTVKHADELDAFREVFKAPAACQGNVLTCPPDLVAKWGRKVMSPPLAPPPAATSGCADSEAKDDCNFALLEGLCGAPAKPGYPSMAEACMDTCGCCRTDINPPSYCPRKEAALV